MSKKRGPNHIHRLRREKGWHELFWLFMYAEWSVQDIAEAFGLEEAVVRQIMDQELIDDHEWLAANERRVA